MNFINYKQHQITSRTNPNKIDIKQKKSPTIIINELNNKSTSTQQISQISIKNRFVVIDKKSDIVTPIVHNTDIYDNMSDNLITTEYDPLLTIGIFSIFIDTYIQFYEKFISNMERRFLPKYKKYYYIVTDKKDIKVLNDRTYFYFTDKIGWPYETLYRYKYYLQFNPDDRIKSNITYFLNSNALCMQTLNSQILPDKSGYVFTIHYVYKKFIYSDLPFEKNKNSTAYTPYIANKNYTYYGGGFFGAVTDKFEQLCIELEKNTVIDETNGMIAKWHDESHLNRYCNIVLNNNFTKNDIEYHVPEQVIKKEHMFVKIIYLDKTKHLKSMSKQSKPKITNGHIILNKYNTEYAKVS